MMKYTLEGSVINGVKSPFGVMEEFVKRRKQLCIYLPGYEGYEPKAGWYPIAQYTEGEKSYSVIHWVNTIIFQITENSLRITSDTGETIEVRKDPNQIYIETTLYNGCEEALDQWCYFFDQLESFFNR